jgi:hypothetical protein
LIDSGAGASASDFAITVDGEPVGNLHTDGGPCEDIPRDVGFRFQAPRIRPMSASPFRCGRT